MTDPSSKDQARSLLILAALKARVKQVDDDLRLDAKDAIDVGTTVTYTLPNPGNEKRPLVVGTAAKRRGSTVAKVGDRESFTAWVKANARTEHYETAGGWEQTKLDANLRAALLDAYESARVASAAGDWADPIADMVTTIAAHGYVVRPAEELPARNEVRPVYETAVLKASVDAGQAVTPDGQVPDGIVVTEGDPTLAVTLSKDSSVVEAFLDTLKPTELATIALGREYVEIQP